MSKAFLVDHQILFFVELAVLVPGMPSVPMFSHLMYLKVELPYPAGPEHKSSALIGLPLANQIARITTSEQFPGAVDWKKKPGTQSKVDTVRFPIFFKRWLERLNEYRKELLFLSKVTFKLFQHC